MLDPAQLAELAAYGRIRHEVLAEYPDLASRGRRLLFEVLRRMLSRQVHAMVDCTLDALREAAPEDADAVRRLPVLAALPAERRAEFTELKRLLFAALYRHPQVVQTTSEARQVVSELFSAYLAAPQALPADFQQTNDQPRAVADYIAGMTDRYALREYHRLTGRVPFPAAMQAAGWPVAV